jgi:hypothetical protein
MTLTGPVRHQVFDSNTVNSAIAGEHPALNCLAVDSAAFLFRCLGRSHGSAFLRLLASSFIRQGAPLVAIDPDAGNLRARRAFARAGFAEDAVVEAKQGVVVLMVFGADARNARKSQALQHPSPAKPARPGIREQPRPKRTGTVQDFFSKPHFAGRKSLM